MYHAFDCRNIVSLELRKVINGSLIQNEMSNKLKSVEWTLVIVVIWNVSDINQNWESSSDVSC